MSSKGHGLTTKPPIAFKIEALESRYYEPPECDCDSHPGWAGECCTENVDYEPDPDREYEEMRERRDGIW